MADSFSNLQGAAHAGAFGVGSNAPSPTPEQIRAGNYAKGATRLHGMPVTIETPMFQSRRGKQDGVPWSVLCMAHYGYINGTKGADGDAVDVFVGPMPESPAVFVVNQQNKGGAFDEHKVLLGFADEESARTAYINSYERGWTGLGSLTPCSIQQFKYWLKHGDLTRALQPGDLISSEAVSMTDVLVSWDAQRQPVGASLMDVLNDIRRQDPEGLLFDSATLADINESLQGGEMLDAMVIEFKQFERKAGQLLKVMQNAAQGVKPVGVEVTKPFKNRGTTQVAMLFTMDDGQTVSVFFHNPDSTPDRLTASDELVSWKWVQNKKDITITVAPERGQDLNPREVARRIMGLIQKNSAKFLLANTSKAERDAKIEELKKANDAKAAELESLDQQIVELTAKLEQKKAQALPSPSVAEPNASSEPTEPPVKSTPAEDGKDFERWEEDVIFAIAAITEMEFSGARGMASDKEELVRQLYADKTPPQKAGEAVVAAAAADPEPEFTPPRKPGPNQFVTQALAQAEETKQKIIALGGTPLSESEFMDKVNAGELAGRSLAVVRAKLQGDQSDLVLLEAGQKTPKAIVGPGGTKHQALTYLHRSIAICEGIIESGGIADVTNSRVYGEELEAQLKSLETQQPPAPPAAPVPEPVTAEPPLPDEDEKLQQAKAYLDKLIAGAENIGTPAEVLVELERIYAGWGEGELKDLFAEASDAYRDYALKATAGAF